MTDKEIKELAKSYTDELFKGDDMSDQENIDAYNDTIVICQAFLGHILESHCIVSKEKVKKWSDESELTVFDSIDLIEIFNDLFGEETFTDKNEKQ